MLLTVVTAAAAVYLLLGALLYFGQRALLYYPTPAVTLPEARRIDFPSNGETLRLWVRENEGPRALIYFGGNAEDVAANYIPFTVLLPDHAVHLVNYRGYGGSTGSPTEAGFFKDALAVYDWVAQRHSQVDVIGTSLGSGVAVYVAANRQVRKLVLLTPYDSIARVAAGHYPLFPVSFLVKDRFESFKRVANIKAPTLAFIAENDQTIPRARSDALFAKFPASQLRVEVIDDAEHNGVTDSQLYLQELKKFLSEQ